RLAVPLSIFSFVIIPLACLLPGEFNRRGQLKRVLLAVVFALVFQSTDLGIKNLAASHYAAIPLMYVIDLLPLALGFGMLLFGGIRFGFWRPAAAVAEPACPPEGAAEAAGDRGCVGAGRARPVCLCR